MTVLRSAAGPVSLRKTSAWTGMLPGGMGLGSGAEGSPW